MTRRYFVDDLPAGGGPVSLGKDEATHATRVMRIAVGDAVTLFDGAGYEAIGEVASIGRNACVVVIDEPREVDREAAGRIELAVAFPKPDRARELVERLTEMGVARLIPIVASRTQRPPSDSLLEKLRRAVVEACKQSGRNRLMLIDPPVSSQAFFSGSFDEATTGHRLIAHPIESVQSSAWETRLAGTPETNDSVAAIGPEGGWTDEEVQWAIQAGFVGIDLGPRIYRIETAAVVIAAKLLS